MHGAMILGRQTGVNKKALNNKVHECMLSRFCRVQLCVTPWTVACQASLSMRIFQARIPEWVAMPSSRGSSQSRDRTLISLIAGRFSLPSEPLGSPYNVYECIYISYQRLLRHVCGQTVQVNSAHSCAARIPEFGKK